MQKLSRAYGHLLEAFAVLAAVILFCMVVIVTTDIVVRNVSHGAILWANEVSEYALYVMTLLTAPWLLRRSQHIRLDLVLVMLPARAAWLVEAVADIVGFCVCLALVRYGTAMAYDSFRIGAITIKNLFFPEWWLLAPLPVCFALVAIEFVFRLHRLIGERARRVEATSVS
jgi:TRAP-type transport system small permease protein